jgi:hypothetical protein
MRAQDVFARLVDIESRYQTCLPVVEKAFPNGIDPSRGQIMFRDCARGEPRNSCKAEISAARNAQIFFERYYKESSSQAGDVEIREWGRACNRPEAATGSPVVIQDECRRSLLLLPIVHEDKKTPDQLFIDWGPYRDSIVRRECGANPDVLTYYGRRCNSIWLVGPDKMGIRENYTNDNRVQEYYDKVDWDVCRVLVRNSLTASLAGYRESH